MKRVLHVGKFYPPVSGGMERAVESICAASAGLVESDVLVANVGPETAKQELPVAYGDPPINGRVQVVRVASIGRVGSVNIAPSFAAHLRAARPDLIVLHEPNPWGLLSYAAVRPSAALAIWYHCDVVRPPLQYALFYAPLAKFAYRRATRIIVSSPVLAEHSTALGAYRDRLCIIPFGIDASEWTAPKPLRSTSASAAQPFVLFAGRHVAYKGVDVLLRALSRIDAHAVIAGDGPKRAEWERLARQLKLTTRVSFAGEVPPGRLRDLMRGCAALVLPSVTRAEAFGYVQLEAMACSKPVISTNVPSGVSWVNQHDRTGLVVPVGDPGALAAAIDRMMKDEPLRSRMGHAARQRVDQEFSMPRFRDRLRALYSEFGLVAEQRRTLSAVSRGCTANSTRSYTFTPCKHG